MFVLNLKKPYAGGDLASAKAGAPKHVYFGSRGKDDPFNHYVYLNSERNKINYFWIKINFLYAEDL